MIRPSLRRTVASTGVVAVAAGLALTGSPASAGTVSFTNFCIATAPIVGNQDQPTPTSVTVDAPATVNAGDTFTYRIQTASSAFPDAAQGATTTNLSRLKFDFEIPANSTFVSATVVPGTGANLGGVAPNVLRINSAGTVDPAGPILRLSGNNAVIANSPTSSLNSDGGIVVPKLKKNLDGSTNANGDSVFQLPAVDVTVVAGSGGTITPKVRVGGSAASSNHDQNYYTMLAKASLFGTQYAPTRCVPKNAKADTALNAGGGALATVTVNAAVPVDVTTGTTLTAPATATAGTPVNLTATVSPAPAGGTVQFKDGATNLGAPVALNGGTATLSQTFATAGTRTVTAVYSGATGFTGSTSAAQTIDVQPATVVAVPTATSVTVPATATTGSAVALSATITPAGASGTVQFAADNTPIGAPVAVVGGIATLSHAFTTAGHHNISASYSGATGFAPSQSASATLAVNAAAPSDVVTVTTVTALSTATQNTQVNLSATVSPSTAGGTVQFKDGTTAIGAPVALVNGVAVLPHTFTTTGGHSITAVYSGAAGFVGSTSNPKAITVSETTTPPTTGGNGSFGG